MNRFLTVAVLATALLIVSFVVAVAASQAASHSRAPVTKTLPPIGDFPDALCNYDASGDVYIGPDGSFWECICEKRTFIDDDCAWYNQGPISRAESRRIKRKLHLSIVPRLRVISL